MASEMQFDLHSRSTSICTRSHLATVPKPVVIELLTEGALERKFHLATPCKYRRVAFRQGNAGWSGTGQASHDVSGHGKSNSRQVRIG